MNDSKKWFNSLIKEFEGDLDYEFEGVILDVTEQIVKLMKTHNINRKKLADKLGCSTAYITKLLRGNQNLTLKKLLEVSLALNSKIKIEIGDEQVLLNYCNNYKEISEIPFNEEKIKVINNYFSNKQNSEYREKNYANYTSDDLAIAS